MRTLYHNTSIFRQAGGYAGKVGGFFTFNNQPGKVFGISNNHVIANLNACAHGDPICVNDATKAVVGSLYSWYKINHKGHNTIDAAFFEVGSDLRPAWNMPGEDVHPTGLRLPIVGERVYINIRNHRNLCDSNINAPSRVGYITQQVPHPLMFSFHGVNLLFTHLYEIQSIYKQCPFSYGGDSGSLILGYDNAVVGILIGGNTVAGQQGSYTSYMAELPIANFDQFGIRLYHT